MINDKDCAWNKQIDSAGSFSITWQATELSITRDSTGFSIHNKGDLNIDSTRWNESLELFCLEVVEPLKDRTGGVAAGIGFR